MEDPILSSPQERSLRSSLLLFEKALRMIDRLLSDGNESGILFSRKSHLNDQTRELIHQKIVATLKELEEYAAILGLKPSKESLESVIMAEMGISWENLEECRSKRMRGYGSLSPRSVEMIDPAIDHFAGIALELSRMATQKPSGEIAH